MDVLPDLQGSGTIGGPEVLVEWSRKGTRPSTIPGTSLSRVTYLTLYPGKSIRGRRVLGCSSLVYRGEGNVP